MTPRSAKAKVFWLVVAGVVLLVLVGLLWWPAADLSESASTMDDVPAAKSSAPVAAAGPESARKPEADQSAATQTEPVAIVPNDSPSSATMGSSEPRTAPHSAAPGLSSLSATSGGNSAQPEAERFPRNWRKCSSMAGSSSMGYRVASDLTNVWRGSASVVIESREAQPNPRGAAICQSVSAAPFKGKRVAFSAHLQTLRATPGAHLMFRADAADGRVVAFGVMLRHWVPGTTPWARHSIVIDVPESAAVIMIGAALVNTGSVWMDEVAVEVVDNDWPVTELAPSVSRYAIPADPASVSMQLMNPGFEETIPAQAGRR